MRLIDADALGNRMYHEVFEKDTEDQRWDSGCWMRYKLFEKVLRDAPTIQPEQHWIPCSERMPELDEDGYSDKVLGCFSNFSGIEILEYRTDKWYVGDMDESPESIGVHVIAWMPLPEPYEGATT